MSPYTWSFLAISYQAITSIYGNQIESIMACGRDWYAFGDKCYKVGGRKEILKYPWEKAQEYCKKEGGNLITINSNDIQEFVTAFLLLQAKHNFWIGLNDKRNESDYEWIDGTKANFTNWSPTEPSGSVHGDEDCTQMYFRIWNFDKDQTGKWNDNSCWRENAFVCEKEQMKYSSVKAPLDPRYCSEENNAGYKFQNSCYNIVYEKLTWHDAENYCKDHYSGHLVAVRDYTVEFFLEYILKEYSDNIWIGIAIKDSFTQKWSSGWFVGYSGWMKGKKDFIQGTCITWFRKKEWSAASCTRKYSFVCESTTDTPPSLTPPVKESTCPDDPDDWLDFGGDMCYFIEMDKELSWYEANFECMQRNGNLLSIHKAEEVNLLQQFVQYTKEEIYIGLHQLQEGKKFVWSDKSPMNFLDWELGEPDRDDESCGQIKTYNMKWHNHVCHLKKPFICSIKKIAVQRNVTVEVSSTPAQERSGGVSNAAVVGIFICAFCIGTVFGVLLERYIIPCSRKNRIQNQTSMSYVEYSTDTNRKLTIRHSLDNDECEN